jgi:hypothetical protein
MLTRKFLLPSALVVALAAAASLALAQPADPFAGTWVLDIPTRTNSIQTSGSSCPALRLTVQIKNNQVTGELTRATSGSGAPIIESGQGRDSGAVKGTVQPDGSLTAQWQNYTASGKLSGDSGQVTVNGECGPRNATATRVSK